MSAPTSPTGPRKPDFVIVGAMKAGTTTLFQWLESHPACEMPEVKEPHYFSRDDVHARGDDWYLSLFPDPGPGRLTGEASASYADPRIGDSIAHRMHGLLPDARLVYLVREPVARLKSHYIHEFRRTRERRSLAEALTDPDNAYVAMSRYDDAHAAFLRSYDAHQILVIDLADLADPDSAGWGRICRHLGIEERRGPDEHANRTSTKMAFSPWLLRLWEAGWLGKAEQRLPKPILRTARRLLTRRSGADLSERIAAVADYEVPPEIVQELTRQWSAVLRSAT